MTVSNVKEQVDIWKSTREGGGTRRSNIFHTPVTLVVTPIFTSVGVIFGVFASKPDERDKIPKCL